jgi:hypothetical protein
VRVKHTPGPWTVCEHSWSRTGIYAKHIGVAALDIEYDADENTQAEWEAVMAANARLIAKAPDLLHCLKVICCHAEGREDLDVALHLDVARALIAEVEAA